MTMDCMGGRERGREEERKGGRGLRQGERSTGVTVTAPTVYASNRDTSASHSTVYASHSTISAAAATHNTGEEAHTVVMDDSSAANR